MQFWTKLLKIENEAETLLFKHQSHENFDVIITVDHSDKSAIFRKKTQNS